MSRPCEICGKWIHSYGPVVTVEEEEAHRSMFHNPTSDFHKITCPSCHTVIRLEIKQ